MSVSPSTLETLSSLSIQVHPVSTGLASQLPSGSMAPQLNQTQWLKLELWSLMSFSRILYLDADTIITANVDEILESPAINKFTCVGDYFAGSVFLVFPSITLFNELSLKSLSGGKVSLNRVIDLNGRCLMHATLLHDSTSTVSKTSLTISSAVTMQPTRRLGKSLLPTTIIVWPRILDIRSCSETRL